jgi:hypothetical protein
MRWERGGPVLERYVSPLAEVFGVSERWLMGTEED